MCGTVPTKSTYQIFQLFQPSQYPHSTFLLLPAAMRIDIKHTTSLYLPGYCIRRPHEVLYALVGLTKAEAETEAEAKQAV